MHRLASCLLAVTVASCGPSTEGPLDDFPDKGDLPACELPREAVADAIEHADSAAALLTQLLAVSMCDGSVGQEAEGLVIDMIAELDARGALAPTVKLLADAALARGAIPQSLAPKLPEMIDQLVGMVDAELCARGRTPACAGNVYVPWPELAAENLAAVRASSSRLGDASFVGELEALSQQPFVSGNAVDVLVDGEASFARRDQLIANAARSIDLLTWAIYDDTTGWDTAHQLVARAQAGVAVHVIVDGQVSERDGYGAVDAYLEQYGIPVIRFRDPLRRYDGNHRKLLVVDGVHAIAGGMNIGDWYSHRGPAGTPKWRDTDVALEGAAVADASRVFAQLWNSQVDANQLALPHLVPSGPPPAAGTARVAVTDHVAGSDATIQRATLKAIEGATTRIDLEPAYFIATPDIHDALMAALARGVEVRLLTNSSESIDEAIMSTPILESLPELLDAGAQVFTKRGDTLHSKFMTVDGLYSWVGSYNLHPRSQRYEGELAIQVLDADFARRLDAAFEADLAAAQRVTRDSLVVPTSAFTFLAARYFYDQL